MTTSSERFAETASASGVEIDVRHFPEGTRTAADAAAAIGCNVGQIVKSLVFMVDDHPVVALTSGANRVGPDRLAATAGGARARAATANEARAATGYAVGGTPPFGHTHPLPVYLDPALLAYDTVWAAAGTPDTCFPIAPGDLARITGATTVDFAVA